tara:strand:- start:309 stop:569 length:261 start_codon:yes stop_codon:yes gene_type:complete
MKVTKSTSRLEPKFTLELSESEANALVAMTMYGHTPFLKGFYTKLGKSYMQPYEAGVISLFSTIGSELPPHIRRIKDARKILEGKS